MPDVPVPRRRLELAGTYNLRDVGGYPAHGGTVRGGKLYRSDSLHALTDDGRAALRELGIRLVIDLRSHREIEAYPNLIDGLGIGVLHAPVYTTNPVEFVTGTLTIESLYLAIVDDWGAHLASVVRHIAHSGDAPVLVHCKAGKDRTGLVIALALLAVGVPRTEVVADYAATETHLAGEWTEATFADHRSKGRTISPEFRAVVSASPPELLELVIDHIDATHGSVADYLVTNGFAREDFALLRKALVT